MAGIPAPLSYLLVACGLATAVLAVLVIYGDMLATREDDQLYLTKGEQVMVSEQQMLISRMDRLKKVIFVLAGVAALLVVASAGTWLYLGLRN